METGNHFKNGVILPNQTSGEIITQSKMNKKLLLLAVAVAGFVTAGFSQNPEVKYRRSSLHTMILEMDNFPQKGVILDAFKNAPFPDKYNNHTIGEKSFDPKAYPLTAAELEAIKAEQSKLSGDKDIERKETPIQIEKYLKQQKVANQLVAKWFNRQPDGSFDMSLISERGSYNASQLEANVAKGSARGVTSLADAGIELIGNTFVVISKFKYVNNEITAAAVRDVAKRAASQLTNQVARMAAEKAADATYEKTKEGYSVWTTSFLYKLKWNDSIEAVFYNDLWMDKNSIDPQRKAAFDNTDLFQLEFIGDEKAAGLVTFKIGEKRTEEQIIEKVTIRTIDAIYAKLQKQYDVFKPKVPLSSGSPITAKIGMKEGLEGGEKFEVLEQVLDPKTGLTRYDSKGTITVEKNSIWDNRYNAADETLATDGPNVTTFKGGKGYYPGMLIKQMK